MDKFVHFDIFTNMENNDRNQKRKEISDFQKKTINKGGKIPLNRNKNSDIRLKSEKGTITPKESKGSIKTKFKKVLSLNPHHTATVLELAKMAKQENNKPELTKLQQQLSFLDEDALELLNDIKN
jgi:hypothetical protein